MMSGRLTIPPQRIRVLFWLFSAILCTVISVYAAPKRPSPAAKRTIREKLNVLQGVRSRISQVRSQITTTRRKENNVIGQIGAVEARLNHTVTQLHTIHATLQRLSADHRMLTRRIALTQRGLSWHQHLLGLRIRQNYEHGDGNYLEVLFRSRSMNDLLSRTYYVHYIVRSDTDLLRRVQAEEHQLIADRTRLARQEAEKQALGGEVQAQTDQYKSDMNQKQSLLHNLQATREGYQESLDILERESAEIEARIQALEQTPSGHARYIQHWNGHFIKPVIGPITSPFGMRFHPILHRWLMHTGVDIGVPYGTPIHAAAAGVVIMAGYMRGYGYTVIIDHGGGVSTLYAHCEELLVHEGEHVDQGKVIGLVGSTGLATGPHLHFEVRINGVPVNPHY